MKYTSQAAPAAPSTLQSRWSPWSRVETSWGVVAGPSPLPPDTTCLGLPGRTAFKTVRGGGLGVWLGWDLFHAWSVWVLRDLQTGQLAPALRHRHGVQVAGALRWPLPS